MVRTARQTHGGAKQHPPQTGSAVDDPFLDCTADSKKAGAKCSRWVEDACAPKSIGEPQGRCIGASIDNGHGQIEVSAGDSATLADQLTSAPIEMELEDSSPPPRKPVAPSAPGCLPKNTATRRELLKRKKQQNPDSAKTKQGPRKTRGQLVFPSMCQDSMIASTPKSHRTRLFNPGDGNGFRPGEVVSEKSAPVSNDFSGVTPPSSETTPTVELGHSDALPPLEMPAEQERRGSGNDGATASLHPNMQSFLGSLFSPMQNVLRRVQQGIEAAAAFSPSPARSRLQEDDGHGPSLQTGSKQCSSGGGELQSPAPIASGDRKAVNGGRRRRAILTPSGGNPTSGKKIKKEKRVLGGGDARDGFLNPVLARPAIEARNECLNAPPMLPVHARLTILEGGVGGAGDEESGGGETVVLHQDSETEEEQAAYLFMASVPPLPKSMRCRPNALPRKTRSSPSVTLALDLDETLVHCSVDPMVDADAVFDVEFNEKLYRVWCRFRPHYMKFLRKVSRLFEVVLFTASQKAYANTVVDIMDPDRKLFKYRLFRDSCMYVNGNFLKDLRILGRHLSQVAIIDNAPQAFSYQISNGIPVSSWYDDKEDQELLRLLPFLESVAQAADVRLLIEQQFKVQTRVNDALVYLANLGAG